MSRIKDRFDQLGQRGETALVPFLTAGDPDIKRTLDLVLELDKAGADVIELGMPFSDPMADGPTIQAASERALAAGTTLEQVLDLVKQVRMTSEIPIVLMGYYNPIFHYGRERFSNDAAAAGVDGLLLVDLPPEEVDEMMPFMAQVGLDMITLMAPTTTPERRVRLAAAAQGYLYYVSMTGVTGAQKITPEAIRTAVEEIRSLADVPVAVGFGISSAEDARAVGAFADGVVVGSALVNIIAEYGDDAQLCERAGAFVRELKSSLL